MIIERIQFSYEQDGVLLSFSFQKDEKLKENIQIFLDLLLKAEDDLRNQLEEK